MEFNSFRTSDLGFRIVKLHQLIYIELFRRDSSQFLDLYFLFPKQNYLSLSVWTGPK